MCEENMKQTWLCCEGGRECVKCLFVGLWDQCGSVGGVRLQACQPRSAGLGRLDKSLVLTTTGAWTGPSSTSFATSRQNRTKADFIVPCQTGENRPPLECGRIGGDVTDLDSFSSNDLCWRQDEEERSYCMCTQVCQD